METEFDQFKYQNEFNKKKYDRVTILLPKGEKEKLKKEAASAGVSLNEYLKNKIFA